MNRRIRKKREKLRSYRVGDHIYTHKEIAMINKAHIGYINARDLYHKIKEPKLTRPRVKSLINHIYKNRMKYAMNLRFARHLFASRRVTANDIFNYRRSMTSDFTRYLNEPDTIPGGKKMKYNSSAYIRFAEDDKHE